MDSHVFRQDSPWGLRWRASYWFTTLVVALGIATDLVVYSIIIPVMPFQLEHLGYKSVSPLVGWLLFAYSAGLVLSTIPAAMLSERYRVRRAPLLIGLVVLIGSQVMLMEAPTYWVMCIARLLQGIGSTMVWVVGLALLCDSTPEKYIGRQLGIAMAGMSLGLLIGPPIGGALYSHFGYRGPFIFGIIATVFDLVGRLLIIERKEALRWGYDPTEIDSEVDSENPGTPTEKTDTSDVKVDEGTSSEPDSAVNPPAEGHTKPLTLVAVVIKLAKSPRTLVAVIISLTYGLVYSVLETTLPLHLQDVWGLGSGKVGLIFLAAVIPTLFSSPLTGWYADRSGTAWVCFGCVLIALPWWVVMIVQRSLAFFIVTFAIQSFFTSGVVSPVTAELAAVARGMEGVGYAHVYGAFNLVFGIGTTIGPVIGGQIYAHVHRGWMALCLLSAGSLAVCLVLAFCYAGDDPLLNQLRQRIESRRVRVPSTAVVR